MPVPDDDDTFTELADQERRRKGQRVSQAPFVRYLILLAAVIVVVVVGGILIRGWLHGREVSSYSTYVNQVSELVKSSDQMGNELSQLLIKPGDSTRKDVQIRLDQYIQNSNTLFTRAKAISTPNALLEAQQWLVATLQFRAQGLSNLKPALVNALDVTDVQVSSDQITKAMQFLLLSDLVYDQFFMTKATDALKERNITGVNLPSSSFLTDENLAEKSKVVEILDTMRSSSNLQAIHGVSLSKVVAMPSEKVIEADGTYNLQSTDQLAFEVTVENQGNMAETDVKVNLTLTSSTSTEPQLKSTTIAELKPKETKKVVINEVSPTPYGEKAALKIEVGPVPNEKVKDNNVIEAHVIFTL